MIATIKENFHALVVEKKYLRRSCYYFYQRKKLDYDIYVQI